MRIARQKGNLTRNKQSTLGFTQAITALEWINCNSRQQSWKGTRVEGDESAKFMHWHYKEKLAANEQFKKTGGSNFKESF